MLRSYATCKHNLVDQLRCWAPFTSIVADSADVRSAVLVVLRMSTRPSFVVDLRPGPNVWFPPKNTQNPWC